MQDGKDRQDHGLRVRLEVVAQSRDQDQRQNHEKQVGQDADASNHLVRRPVGADEIKELAEDDSQASGEEPGGFDGQLL